MQDLLVVFAQLLTTLANLLGPGGSRAIVADSLRLKQQLLIINRSRRRAPNLSATERILLGFWSLFLSPRRIRRSAVIIKPSTLLRFHEALEKRKYRLLYSSRPRRKPGTKGPSKELIRVIVEMKRRNPGYGCPRIAAQLAKLFGIEIDYDIVRRVLARHSQVDAEHLICFKQEIRELISRYAAPGLIRLQLISRGRISRPEDSFRQVA